MAIKTYTEQLEEVQAAISAIVSGAQYYQINGRAVTKASLNTLYDHEKYLRSMVAQEAGGGISVKGIVPGR